MYGKSADDTFSDIRRNFIISKQKQKITHLY